ncbi:MAG: C40 family peptidase [Elusimicrobia bacterium]|nr:C40 family peptidase [Elusimicrobiota bacterium]
MSALLPLLLAGLLSAPAAAQGRRNVMETLGAALTADRAYDDAERARLLEALRVRFADYGVQVVDERRKAAIPVVLHVITEGSFDAEPPERMADVAFAAYQAMSRGAPPEEVEGIALYGYRKKIPGDTIAAWANGYRQAVDAKVPPAVAADLVNFAMNRDLSVSDFDILKWALVNGVKDGFDAKDYATYLLGTMALGKSGPGTISAQAKAEFRRARARKRHPRLPAYAGTFAPAAPPAPSYVAPLHPGTDVEVPSKTESPARVEPPARSVSPPPAQPAGPKLAALWPGLDATYRTYLGTPYVWGGTSHAGIDCSGLTSNTYGENRVKIPRVSRDQWRVGTGVAGPALRDGDLVFFNTLGVGVSHVGMVVDAKNRRFVQASSSKGVTVSDLDGKYYKTRYLGARRVVP